MTATTHTQVSRRTALALAAALIATAATAVAAVGGLQHRPSPAVTPGVPQVSFAQPAVTAAPTSETDAS